MYCVNGILVAAIIYYWKWNPPPNPCRHLGESINTHDEAPTSEQNAGTVVQVAESVHEPPVENTSDARSILRPKSDVLFEHWRYLVCDGSRFQHDRLFVRVVELFPRGLLMICRIHGLGLGLGYPKAAVASRLLSRRVLGLVRLMTARVIHFLTI